MKTKNAIFKNLKPKLVTSKFKLIQKFVKNKTTLDFGCVAHTSEREKQDQWLHKNIQNVAKEVLGIDYDKEEILKLKKIGYNVEYGDVENLNIGQKFDVLVAGDIIEHLNNPGNFLSSSIKHMNRNSQLIISTSNATGLIYVIEAMLLGYEINNPDHVSYYTFRTLDQLMKRHGLMITELFYLTENSSYMYDKYSLRALSYMKFLFQLFFTFLRPCLAQQIVIICKLK
jgi:2-polyprenyl-3-methyl-5-hydroxy-6-metoxy-1,4-benzoquinol methylase